MSARVTQAEMDDLERRIRRLEANAARLAAAAKGKPVMVPLERSGEPLLGWRLWTVFPWTDVRGRATVRLKSYNGHASWPPREAMHAACNGIQGAGNEAHDAPHPGCTCGVWAFRSRGLLDERTEMMRGWVDDELGADVAIAVGQVSLWGRILEFRDGYRAERAYPYALTVLSEDAATARTVAHAYGVDVDWQPWTPPTSVIPENGRPDAEEDADEEAGEHVVAPELTDADALRGLVLGCLYERKRTCTAYEIQARLENDGTIPMLSGRPLSAKGGWAAIAKAMKRLEDQGLIDRGYARAYEKGPTRLHRLTDAGITEARRLLGHRTRIKAIYRHGRAETLTVAAALRRIEAMPEVLFAPEIQQERDTWTPKRLAAKRKGRRYYREWLDERRQTVRGRAGLYYSDEEVIAAVAEAARNASRHGADRGYVGSAAIIDRLAPGAYTTEERCPVSYKLTKLAKSGELKGKRINGKPHWAPRERVRP